MGICDQLDRTKCAVWVDPPVLGTSSNENYNQLSLIHQTLYLLHTYTDTAAMPICLLIGHLQIVQSLQLSVLPKLDQNCIWGIHALPAN